MGLRASRSDPPRAVHGVGNRLRDDGGEPQDLRGAYRSGRRQPARRRQRREGRACPGRSRPPRDHQRLPADQRRRNRRGVGGTNARRRRSRTGHWDRPVPGAGRPGRRARLARLLPGRPAGGGRAGRRDLPRPLPGPRGRRRPRRVLGARGRGRARASNRGDPAAASVRRDAKPRKEYWLAQHLDQLGVPFAMGVGGAFDVVAGTTRRAPEWMQRAGMEWLFRLVQEPRRMWRRYLVGNSRFALMLLRERFAPRRAQR